jgi:hypothetical protein
LFCHQKSQELLSTQERDRERRERELEKIGLFCSVLHQFSNSPVQLRLLILCLRFKGLLMLLQLSHCGQNSELIDVWLKFHHCSSKCKLENNLMKNTALLPVHYIDDT